MTNEQNSLFGITGVIDIKAGDYFEKASDYEGETIYVSKKVYEHHEPDLNFKYQYAVVVLDLWEELGEEEVGDDRYVVSIELFVHKDSLSAGYIESVLDCMGLDSKENICHYDLLHFGGASVRMTHEFLKEGEDLEETLLKAYSIIPAIDNVRGFYLDKEVNFMGDTGWDNISEVVNN